jgi:hypothetical protein
MSSARKHAGDLPILVTRRTAAARSAMGRWFYRGGGLDEESGHTEKKPWSLVLWLTGVDYFSTLGYQPGIALLAAGALAPFSTLLLLAVTLFGALPVYAQVAEHSYVGQGSIAMLENLLSGWKSKLFVLVLLGFAGTDFIITMTLSAADAARHAIENPYMHRYVGDSPVWLTIALLLLLAIVFLKGFLEAIGLAAAVAVPYLMLNLAVLARGIVEIIHRPWLLANWTNGLHGQGDWTMLLLASAIVFPKLALGMSGFETGVSVMPLISSDDKGSGQPAGRIRNTRKLLLAAALIMSFMLLVSSFVSTLLVPEQAYRIGGLASGRAIAWLAHKWMGPAFGTVYDVSTIAILWFAGASAMAGLLNLIPRYLPRFGMAPRWAAFRRPLIVVFFGVNVLVTLIFRASVERQAGAYATGVLVLMLSAAIAVALSLWRHGSASGGGPKRLQSGYFWLVALVFAYTLVANVIERPDGVVIATIFISAILIIGGISRYNRATELRVTEFNFADSRSAALWPSLVDKKVHLVPLRGSTPASRRHKQAEIRKCYRIEGPMAFIHVDLLDNRSEFMAPLIVSVDQEDGNYLVSVSGAIAIANTVAYVSELIDPISIIIGLTRQNLMMQSLRFLLWGEGETAWMVYMILVKYWEWTPENDIKPYIFLMSDQSTASISRAVPSAGP